MMGLKGISIHPHFQTSSLSQELDQNQISSGALLGVGWGKASLVFGPDLIRTLVYMATDSSHRVIMGESL